MMLPNKKTDKTSYNQAYKGRISPFANNCNTPEEYITNFEKKALTPFCNGGPTKGYVRGLAATKLLETTSSSAVNKKDITILDAGCGTGAVILILLNKFRKLNPQITGLEINKKHLLPTKYNAQSQSEESPRTHP